MNEIVRIVSHPLMLPIMIALVAGALAYVFSRWSRLLCRFLAVVGSTAVLVGGILIARTPTAATFSCTWVEQLTENISLTVDLAASPLGLLVAIGAAAFALLISIYSLRAMAGEYWEGKFYAYLLWALGGACIVALAGNLLVLLVGWELVTLMLFLMINQGRKNAKAGAAKAYGILGFADACLLLAVALLASADGGSANWSLTRGPVSVATLGAIGYAAYALILVAALAKAGAIPLHTWIPAIAADAPTPVMAYLPAALDKLLGIYLLAVLVLQMFKPDPTFQVILMIVGAVTILAAVLMAMMQHNLKKLLSFHAVSQVGYMVLGIGTGTPIGILGGLFHMLNHAIYKSNLFLMSGTVSRAVGSDEIEDMGGLARFLPVTFICTLVAAAAISGVPPFNGFVSKWLIYQGALGVSGRSSGLAVVLVSVAVFGSALTLASFVKVIYSAFLSPAPKGATYLQRRPRESLFMAAPMVVLALACVVLGLWPQLAIDHMLTPPADASAAGIASEVGAIRTPTGLWNPTQATGLALIGLALGMTLVWVATRKSKVRVVRPFLAGEVPADNDDRFRVPGTHFYRTVARMPIIGPLLAHGEGGAMDPYHWAGKHGHTLVEVLRRWHTGLVNLYVAWCLLGLTITLVYLMLTART